MLLKLILALVIVPVVELALLIEIGARVGSAHTFALVVTTGVIGGALARREGLSVLHKLAEESQRGFPAGDRVIEAVLVLAGGLLLLAPGILTDLFGFSLIVPATRRWMAPRLKAALMENVKIHGLHVGSMRAPGAPPRPEPAEPTNDSPTLGPDGSRFEHPTY